MQRNVNDIAVMFPSVLCCFGAGRGECVGRVWCEIEGPGIQKMSFPSLGNAAPMEGMVVLFPQLAGFSFGEAFVLIVWVSWCIPSEYGVLSATFCVHGTVVFCSDVLSAVSRFRPHLSPSQRLSYTFFLLLLLLLLLLLPC